MTGKLARALGRVPEEAMPKVCPKCGRMMQEPYGDRLVAHFRAEHRQSVGTAISKTTPERAREFVYLAPVAGTTGSWHVVWLDWPYEAFRMTRSLYVIEWLVGEPKEA